jgi:hypothetical protein
VAGVCHIPGRGYGNRPCRLALAPRPGDQGSRTLQAGLLPGAAVPVIALVVHKRCVRVVSHRQRHTCASVADRSKQEFFPARVHVVRGTVALRHGLVLVEYVAGAFGWGGVASRIAGKGFYFLENTGCLGVADRLGLVEAVVSAVLQRVLPVITAEELVRLSIKLLPPIL